MRKIFLLFVVSICLFAKGRIRLFCILLFVGGLPTALHAQYNEWTWMAGDSTPSQPGVYGIQGVAAPTNKPGARYEGGGEWVDLQQGNFWHFGGTHDPNPGDFKNDLWKFDPVTTWWTWIHGSTFPNEPGVFGALGVPNIANTPGGRGYASATCVDLQGKFWLFGGVGVAGSHNDLWKYDPLSNMWTWISGSQLGDQSGTYGTKGVPSAANKPGGRSETDAMWADAQGNIWLFGGSGYDGIGGVGNLNDLWKFDTVTTQWTWMSGSDIVDQPGVYGIQGVPDPANVPGARFQYANWKDLAGNFWLFGGLSFQDDLWKYDPLTNEWTWMKGAAGVGNNGTYGTKCVDAPTNNPPAVFENRARWEDDCGNFWVLGGCNVTVAGNRNCLWRYSHATGNWTWVSGSDLPFQSGVYGAKGVSSPTNMPGARCGNLPFRRATPNTNELWVFGGAFLLNDMWRYVPDKPTASFTFNPNNACAPATVSFTNTSAPGCNEIKSYTWNFGDTASGANNTSTVTNPSHIYNTAGTYTVQLLVINCTASKDSITQILTVAPTPTASVSPDTTICAGNNATLTASGGGTYSWIPGGQTTAVINPSSAGTYSVIVSIGSCSDTAATILTVAPTPTASVSPGTTICAGNSATLTASGGGTYSWIPGGQTTAIINPSTAGTYSVIVSIGSCSDTAYTTVVVNPNPTATAAANVTITQGQSTTLTASGGGNYLWSNGQTTSTIVVSPIITTVYCVTVTDANGCTATACVTVTIFIEPLDCSIAGELFIPNAFSPNGDLENDVLKLHYGNIVCIKTYKLIIYNRWGEKVFETTNPIAEWDGSYKGKIEGSAVFVYYMKATLITGEEIIKKGNISLIR